MQKTSPCKLLAASRLLSEPLVEVTWVLRLFERLQPLTTWVSAENNVAGGTDIEIAVGGVNQLQGDMGSLISGGGRADVPHCSRLRTLMVVREYGEVNHKQITAKMEARGVRGKESTK